MKNKEYISLLKNNRIVHDYEGISLKSIWYI